MCGKQAGYIKPDSYYSAVICAEGVTLSKTDEASPNGIDCSICKAQMLSKTLWRV